MRRAALLAILALGLLPLAGTAQVPVRLDTLSVDPLVVDTIVSDTVPLTARDSAAMRVRARLEGLARPLGVLPDSLAADSLGGLVNLPGGARPARGGEAGGVSGTDSISQALLQLTGYRATQYAGAGATFDARTDVLTLLGRPDTQAVLRSTEGYQLAADSLIRFNQATERVAARGTPVFTPAEGEAFTADSLAFDVRTQVGSAFGGRTTYSQGGGTTWNVYGDLPQVGQDVYYGSHAQFTSCDLEDPHYHFAAGEMKIVRGGILVARPVTLYFADVPVAWLPFIAQNTAQGRSSGILTPTFSVNDIVRTSGGYKRRISNVGVYWAVSDYMDAALAFDWFSDTYTALQGSVRYRWLRQFLDGSVNVRRYWRVGGRRELAFDTQNQWEISERTRFQMSAQYASSSEFVRDVSFDPREVTQQIRSSGGLTHRFDWGNVNIGADRSQSLSDDKVEMTLPNLSLSLNPITLFAAPPNRAAWYNNVTWNGSARLRRTTSQREADTLGFSFRTADVGNLNGNLNSALTMGNFGFSQSFTYEERGVFDVPRDTLIFFPDLVAERGLAGLQSDEARRALANQVTGEQLVDIADARFDWSLGLDYQQTLIGSTTFTPRLSLSGNARRADTVDVAADGFVSAPTRLSFGATLRGDLYGFYPGFRGFSAVRHKLSPAFTYDWAPATEPSELQRRVFGALALQPRSVVGVTLNQTWEAKRAAAEPGADSLSTDSLGGAGTVDLGADNPPPIEEPAGIDDTPPALPTSDAGTPGDLTRPRPGVEGEIVNLLSLRTSVIDYDFVQADSTGDFLQGFRTTSLNNTISSDFLRGLTISTTHDLFDDGRTITGVPGVPGGTPGEDGPARRFDPHLRSVNFGFNLNPQSALFRWLGIGGSPDGTGQAPDTAGATVEDPFTQRSGLDDSRVIPGRGTEDEQRRAGGGGGDDFRTGDWRAAFTYALNRPREGAPGVTNQTLGINVSLTPTAQWEVDWRTTYNLELGEFSDQSVRLTRDLHRWQAHFDFLRTVTGNFAFRFEVSLIDNDDLKFDYEQRSDVRDRLLRPGG